MQDNQLTNQTNNLETSEASQPIDTEAVATMPEPTPEPEKPREISLDETVGHDRFDDVFSEYQLGKIEHYQFKNNALVVRTATKVSMSIAFWNERTLRIRVAPKGRFERDFSYSVLPESHQPISPKILEQGDFLILENNFLKIHIKKSDAQILVFDANNQKIMASASGTEGGSFYAKTTMERGTCDVRYTLEAHDEDYFFGLGDKSCSLNLRGKSFENWCTDAFGFWIDTDPLYRAVPFFYGINPTSHYGLFFDNTFRSHFDFDTHKKNKVTFSAEGGEINFYVLTGDTPTHITQQYHRLTGVAPLPPLWALGFHQCRWSYYPEKRVRELAAEFRSRRIPCDAIYLDIDYMDEYRCFTWNNKHFPNPTKLIDDLTNEGFQTVVMIDPGIKVDDNYPVFSEGIENDYFIKRGNGELMLGYVWPGETVFPDFTHPKVREWWGNLYQRLYCENHIAGFWNDMNEPANFKVNRKTIPDDCQHFYEGHPTNHARAHNVYGMLMAQSSYEGFKRLKPEKRPFLLTRASFSGGQRYAAVWTGDNVASWEHLAMANRQMLRLAASGFSFSGSDIGGFVDVPSGELMVRWLQLAIFHPVMRIHSMGNNESGDSQNDNTAVSAAEALNRLDQEPWAYGEPFTSAARRAIELRYELLPYIYTTFWQHTEGGLPMMRSLAFEDATNVNCLENEQESMFGQDLLFSPIVAQGIENQSVYLPRGDWFNFDNGENFVGVKKHTLKVDLQSILIFAKAGATIPMYPIVQHIGEARKVELLHLKVFFTKTNYESKHYEDEGEGYGTKRVTTYHTSRPDADSFRWQRTSEGIFEPSYKWLEIKFLGLPFSPKRVIIDGKKYDWDATTEGDNADHVTTMKVDATVQEILLLATEEPIKEGFLKKMWRKIFK